MLLIDLRSIFINKMNNVVFDVLMYDFNVLKCVCSYINSIIFED